MSNGIEAVVDALYSRFLLRDVFGKMLPGAILLVGVASQVPLDPLFRDARSLPLHLAVLFLGLCWLSGFVAQGVGRIRWLGMPRSRLIWYDPFEEGDDDWLRWRWLHGELSERVRRSDGERQVERMIVIKEACGNAYVALLAAAAVNISYAGWRVASQTGLNEAQQLLRDYVTKSLPLAVVVALMILVLRGMHFDHVSRQFVLTCTIARVPEEELHQLGLNLRWLATSRNWRPSPSIFMLLSVLALAAMFVVGVTLASLLRSGGGNMLDALAFASTGWVVIGLPVLGGIAAAAIWAAGQAAFRRIQRRRFRKLAGQYVQERNGGGRGTGEIINVRVDGHVLHVNSEGLPGSTTGPWSGSIEMSDAFPTRGSGWYRHDNVDAWGFVELQQRGDNELLVHHHWTQPVERGPASQPILLAAVADCTDSAAKSAHSAPIPLGA